MRTLLLLLTATPFLAAQVVSVSPRGSIRTLAAARDAVRSIHAKTPAAIVTVRISGGTYYLPKR